MTHAAPGSRRQGPRQDRCVSCVRGGVAYCRRVSRCRTGNPTVEHRHDTRPAHTHSTLLGPPQPSTACLQSAGVRCGTARTRTISSSFSQPYGTIPRTKPCSITVRYLFISLLVRPVGCDELPWRTGPRRAEGRKDDVLAAPRAANTRAGPGAPGVQCAVCMVNAQYDMAVGPESGMPFAIAVETLTPRLQHPLSPPPSTAVCLRFIQVSYHVSVLSS